jgi:hypothetical protein
MKYLPIAVIAAAATVAGPAFAKPGDTLTVGAVQAPNHLTATFTDNESGTTYHFFLEARETFPADAHPMQTTFGLRGPGLSGCSVHGGQELLNPSSTPFAYGGSSPDLGCGTASAQAISIQGCVARIQTHGIIHSDAPNVTYLGMTTIEVRYQKKRSPGKDEIEVKLYTPKDVIKLSGKATFTEGPLATMASCND